MKFTRLIEKSIIQMTRSMNLKRKIIILYCFIVIGPMALLAVGAAFLSLQQFRTNYLLTINEAVRQSAQNIEFKKQSYDLLVYRTATDGELISRLSRNYTAMDERLETVRYVDRAFSYTTTYLPGIEDFRIYHTNYTLVEDGNLLLIPNEQLITGVTESWYNQTINSTEVINWINAQDDKRNLVVSQKIFSKYGEMYGVIYLLLNYNDIFLEPFNQPFSGEGSFYIIDNFEQIIASSKTEEIGKPLNETSLNQYWDSQKDESTPDGKLLIKYKLETGWTVASLVHLDRLEEQSKRILLLVGIGFVFFLLISTLLLTIVIKNVVWRIRKLGNRMVDISGGIFDVRVISRNEDELGELETIFNQMSKKLGKLVEENLQANLKEREQSFKTLQAQINPHFIYNSLSLIRWRAMDMNDDKQIRIIDAMTTFYRLALNNRENVTKISEELKHLKAYIEIQQQRYPGQVTVEWQIDSDLLDLYTIKMVLQPIVENSYIHGKIFISKNALIRVSIYRMQETIYLTVFDTGKGISPDALKQIQSGNHTGTRNGFGVNNIKERLQLYFGSYAKLEIDSIEDEWTMVSIQMPLCKEKPIIQKR